MRHIRSAIAVADLIALCVAAQMLLMPQAHAAPEDFVDLSFSNNLRNSFPGVFVRRNRFKRVRQDAQFI